MPSKFLYGVTVFCGAFLLFLIEPLAAKQLLPVLGGSSAVWMTCLVFFQLLLLFGYLYAHVLTTAVPAAMQKPLHLTLLAVATVLALLRFHPNIANASEHPITTIFATLMLTIGLPFLLLSSTSPLLQVWLARQQGAPVQYRLFALSNAGSLLALLSYPSIFEPNLTLHHQTLVWSLGFVVYALFAVLLTRDARTANQVVKDLDESTATPNASTRQRALWFLLPMVAAMQLSAITGHLTQDIAAIPLLWVLPLGAYLLTFIAAFEAPRLYHRGLVIRLLIVMLAALGYMLSQTNYSLPIALAVGFFLLELFIAAYFCHAEAHALRPENPAETTLFYLLIAAGGVTGTFLVGIASPILFSGNYDVALSFMLTAVAGLAVTWQSGWMQRLLWSTGTGLLLFLCIALNIVYAHNSLVLERNFYSALRVQQTYEPAQQAVVRTLINGHITHGTQWFSPETQHLPTTYYSIGSGIGLALARCCTGHTRHIGVIGLGAGTIAAYGKPGDRIHFYEINPAVQPIASHLFTYLRDSRAEVIYAEGDARLSLSREQPQQFDVLVVDAFSGDAIPLHLLTREAMQLYQHHLAPNGVIAFHISNSFLDLSAPIANLASAAGMHTRHVQSTGQESKGAYIADWVLVTNNQDILNDHLITELSTELHPNPKQRLWTDDYSALLPIIKPLTLRNR